MQDVQKSVDVSYSDLGPEDWKRAIEDLAEEHGAFQPLGDKCFSAFVEAGKTLLVTFETMETVRTTSAKARPLGHEMIISAGWSHLAILSESTSWFRDPIIFGYFDRLIDDGFFEDFDSVLFYGVGACGYAAAAYSVAAPGAKVLALQPHATMDPRLTEWDPRFPAARRLNFSDRFGYAPDMLDAAEQAFVLYDPFEDLDAMHAALFERPGVTRLRVPHGGETLEAALQEMELLLPLLEHAESGTLDILSFARLFRARRQNTTYLRRLLFRLETQGRPYLSFAMCRQVVKERDAPFFRRRLRRLKAAAMRGDFRAPPTRAKTQDAPA
ncbi:MAG: phosphoadenosine phosphosulfate reductase [Paracoccaceae bacterium]